jgi:alanyl-tRNA synthetase
LTTDEIRASFLNFFRDRGHVIERSDRVVPASDPSLLFTSAGMVQFKPFYTGEVPVPYTRAATAQKCLRAGGKANDLDEVGKTARHMTFFEMLGNFSFGDYFKQEAIEWAWEYCTQVLGIDGDLIYVSIYTDDDEAAAIWEKEAGLPSSRITRLGDKDNFWGPAGETGACGPCSELHIDRGASEGCGEPDCAPGCERCERFLEFWNLVFPQFDQQLDGSRPPLKNRGIDTGMGLERLAAILQKKDTVFDIDGMTPMIAAAEAACNVKYSDRPVPFRVIADHARAVAFMIADGILPANDGRGYVERRLLRRAARFGRELGLDRPFLYTVADAVVETMAHQYPELAEKRVQIEKVIETEEKRFGSTLARGMDLLDEALEKANAKTVDGGTLFKLYDTYGFPIDLATDIVEDRGYTVDREGFDAAMARQKEKARQSWKGSGAEAVPDAYRKAHDELGDTVFVGYDTTECEAKITGVFRDGKAVDALNEGETGEVTLDPTPFYARSGGQVGDTGVLDGADANAMVTDTYPGLPKFALHKVEVTRGVLRVGDSVLASADADQRKEIMCHHSATHLLQAALQTTLGEHVHQAGSLVAPDRLRFDFTHFEGIDADRLADIERLVNSYIRTDTPVKTELMPLDEAREAGAMALFGEKYDDVVRVVTMGDISMELCGGTHVDSTGSLGAFKIVSESSISSGVRRIEAVCGESGLNVIQENEAAVARAAAMLNAAPSELESRVSSLLEEKKQLEREVAKWKQAAATGGSVDYMSKVQDVGGVKLLAAEVQGQDAAGLRLVLDKLRDQLASGVIVLGAAENGKCSVCVAVSNDLTDRVQAGKIVKELAPIVGGGGGGRPDMAQAGGKSPENLPKLLETAPNVLRSMLG